MIRRQCVRAFAGACPSAPAFLPLAHALAITPIPHLFDRDRAGTGKVFAMCIAYIGRSSKMSVVVITPMEMMDRYGLGEGPAEERAPERAF